jgi:hypothetical protein
MKTKVFCVGFHKTGTTSLALALEILDYRVAGPTGINDPNIAKNVLSWHMAWWINTMPFKTALGQ